MLDFSFGLPCCLTQPEWFMYFQGKSKVIRKAGKNEFFMLRHTCVVLYLTFQTNISDFWKSINDQDYHDLTLQRVWTCGKQWGQKKTEQRVERREKQKKGKDWSLNCRIELYTCCCGGSAAVSTCRFLEVMWLWWIWGVREFPSSLSIHNEPNLFGHILPSDTVIEICDWLVVTQWAVSLHFFIFLCFCAFTLL